MGGYCDEGLVRLERLENIGSDVLVSAETEIVIWTCRIGKSENNRLPLLIVAGGPGLSSEYLQSLAILAKGGREVIFYDTLGAGRSEHPESPPPYTVERAVNELAELIHAIGLQNLHLLAHSSGAITALRYALRSPEKVASLVAYSPIVDFDFWMREQTRLRSELDPGLRRDADAELNAYYRKHLCRLDPWPDDLMASVNGLGADPRIFIEMYGAHLYSLTGRLAGFSMLSVLPSITVPTLVIGGRHDYATPAMLDAVAGALPFAERATLPNSSHAAHLEEPEAFTLAVTAFLMKHD